MFLTEKFGAFIAAASYETLPAELIPMVRERIMDTLGACLAGAVNWDYSEKFRAACARLGRGDWAAFGSGEKIYPTARAAAIDATYAHGIELDDGHRNAGAHAGSVVVPTALMLGAENGSSAHEIVTAIAVGYEVIYRIASSANPMLINKGFHPSSCCDVFGSAATAAKLLGLDARQSAAAIGQAAMLASGTMEATKSGQLSKCVQVGNAAFNGIMAAYTAQEGMEGCWSGLEGPNGFFNAIAENVDSEAVPRDLGVKWSLADTYNKMYPSCRHVQPAIEGTLDLVAEYDLTPDMVESILIGTHRVAYELTGKIMAPRSSGEAKFSAAYGAASALRDRRFGVPNLTPKMYEDPELLALAQKVHSEIDPDVQAVFPGKRGAKVTIKLKDGRVLSKEVYDLKGSPNNPVGWAELEAKFRANTADAISPENIDKVVAYCANFENTSGAAELLSLICC